MASHQVGLSAEGLCLEPLLEYGVPGSQAVDTILKDIGLQLAENQTRIEECVKELMEMSQAASGRKEKFTHPTDAIQHLVDNRLLEKGMCYDPDSAAIVKLLKSLILTLQKNPGCEEKVFQQLMELASVEGLSLPCCISETDLMAQSTVSINAAIHDTERLTENLWNDICLKLKKYYLDELKKLPVGSGEPRIQVGGNKRLQYVQSLCSLFPPDRVWTYYHILRSQQLEASIRQSYSVVPSASPLIGGKKSRGASFASRACNFADFIQKVIIMTSDDFDLLNSGVFSNVITPIHAVSEIYADRLSEEITAILEQLQSEAGQGGGAGKKDTWRKNAREKDKDMPKSPSDGGFLQQLRGSGRKPNQSKSADNLLAQSEDATFSDIQALPSGYLEPLSRLISAIHRLESHMEMLHSATVWEMTVGVGKKTPSKRHLKSVLKTSHLVDDDTKKQAFSPRSFEMSGLLPEAVPAPYGGAQAMIAQLSASLKVVEGPADERVVWAWRATLSKIAPDVAKSIAGHIRAVTESALGDLERAFQKSGIVPAADVQAQLVGGRLDYPKAVARCVLVVMNDVDQLLPLAVVAKDGPTAVIRSAFVAATTLYLKNISAALNKICGSANDDGVTENLLVVLSSEAYMRNHLLHYDGCLGVEEQGTKVFSTLYRQLCEEVDSLTHRLIQCHSLQLCVYLLHDAESHHWEDAKEFYEGERCSFSVQMWNYYLRSLQHDLWRQCPPKLAQSVYAAVLSESLRTLCQHYARAKPAFRRTTQFRLDITAILLCVSQLLLPACSSVSKYLEPTDSHKDHYSIHNSCCGLLGALVVVTAPLDVLYKTFKKGFKKRKSHSEEELLKGYLSHWMSWIQPDLIPMGKTGYDDLQTTSALYLQLQLLSSQPEFNCSMLLQTVLMKDYTLPIMLLSHLAIQYNGLAPTSQESARPAARQIFTAFLDVLLKCDSFPDAAARVFVPVFERSETWELFDAKTALSDENTPPWLDALLSCLEHIVVRVLDPGLRVLLLRHNEPVGVEPLTQRLKHLPCGCEPVSKTENRLGQRVSRSTSDLIDSVIESNPELAGSRDVLAEAVYSVITQLVEDVYTLPTALIMLFKALQSQLNQNDIEAPHHSPGIKIIASSLRRALLDIPYLESLIGRNLPEAVRDSVRALADCVYCVLTSSSYGKGSGTPRVAGVFIKANRNWVTEQVETLCEHFAHDAFELPDFHPLEGSSAEFIEHQLMVQGSQILSSARGEQSLMTIYNLIRNNSDWIVSQLDIPTLLSDGASSTAPGGKVAPLSSNLTPQGATPFNPLAVYNKIGKHQFDHAKIMDFPWDWAALMQSDLGMSEVIFRTLLFNRHEMADGAYLQEQEKKPVESLRKRFHAESVDIM